MAYFSTRWISCLGAAVALAALLATAPARANTAALFNGGAVAGCTYAAASTTYTCPPFAPSQDVTIASGYKVVLTGPMDFDFNQQLNMSGTAQLQVAGNLDIGGVKTSNLNITGGSLVSSGEFKMGAQVQTIVANISAASMKIGTGSATKVTGTLTATGQIDIASHATIIGPITGGKVTTGSPVALTGDVTASVSFNLSSGSTLNGNLVSPVVSLDASPSRVNGNVTANTSLTIASASSVNGNVVAGAVVLQSSEAYITGTALVDSLKLNWRGRVYQAVTCRTGTSGSPCNCVDDQSGYKSTPSETVCVAPVSNTTVHHYQITHDGAGLTCQPENVTVKACANAACTTLYNGTAQVRLSPNSVESPAPPFSLPNGSGSAYVRQTTKGAATLAITSATPTATASTTCAGPSGASCDMTFAEAGFEVSAEDRKSGDARPFTVRALTAPPGNNPSSCVPLIANSTRTIAMRCAYVDPPANGNAPSRSVNLTGVAPSTAALVCSPGVAGNLSLQFNQAGLATGNLMYDDVGQLALSAEYTANGANFATGSSLPFLVTPYTFSITNASASGVANPGATSAADAAFTKAGASFSVMVTALSKNNVITTNFGRELTPGRFTLTHALVDPAPTPNLDNVGTLTLPNPAAIAAAINAGAQGATPGRFIIGNLSWNEVGIITLTAATNTSEAYGGLYKGLPVHLVGSGTSATIGRFIPDHFDTAITAPDATPVMACPAGVFPITCAANRFVYAVQPFGLTVNAMSGGAAPTLTRNYAGSYARPIVITAWNAAGAIGDGNDNPEFRPVDNAATSIPARAEDVGGPGGPAIATPFAFTAGLGKGEIRYAFSKSLNTAQQLTTISRPVNVFFRATDGDGVTSLRGAASVEAGIAVVAGRLQVANSYGSELLRRQVNVESQYWTGSQFLHNKADAAQGTTALGDVDVLKFSGCTKSLAAGAGCFAGLAAAEPAARLNFTGGRATLRVSAPGAGRSGNAVLRVDAFPWLPSTAGRLTYGVYSSPVIYLRELY